VWNKPHKSIFTDMLYHKRWCSRRQTLIAHSSFQLYLFDCKVQLGPGPLRCPSLTCLQAYKSYTCPFSLSLVFGRKGTDHLPRSSDLVVPNLPACRCEWCRRLVSPSTGGGWWATYHDESCARYSRRWLRCGIGVLPLLPPPFIPFTKSGGAGSTQMLSKNLG